MSDRLYLSGWVQGFSAFSQLRAYGKLLDLFPTSKLNRTPQVLRVHAVGYSEPPVLEKSFEPGTSPTDILTAAREVAGGDCAFDLDTYWDLWQFDCEWRLFPAPVTISCYGPDFEQDSDDHLRLDFGLDAKFLLLPEVPGSARMQQSNLRGLLHLVAELESGVPLKRRRLWSESGANFADAVARAVARF
jgi:hypothetical protein